MPHTINGYQCDFCNRTFYRKVDALNHEWACKYNPARRSCYTCKHYERKEYTRIEPGYFEGEGEHEVTAEGLICTHHNKPIHDKPYYIDCETGEEICDIYGNVKGKPIPGSCLWWEEKEKENASRKL